ncbi:MAG: sulfite exporter TauE/SafE family protein [Burkholderiaceae bacterium]
MSFLGIEPLLFAQLGLLGIAAGFLAGLLGIGGGMVMVPFLTHLLTERGVPAPLAVKMAIATAMATILFTSLSTMQAHHRRGAVRWDLVAAMSPGVLLGGLLAGAGAFAWFKGQWLALSFSAFVALMATQMLIDRPAKPGRRLPGRFGLAGAGAGIGFVSGLVGAGGAFITVPFLGRGNVPMREAVATGASLGFPIAAANTLGYVVGGWSQPAPLPGAFGFLYLPALVAIAVCSVTTAPWGARLAHSLPVRRLKRLFALMLYAIAAYMAWGALV